MSIPTHIEIDGHIYKGCFEVQGPNITVRYLSRTLTDTYGRTPPGLAAKGLLKQLVKMVRDLDHAA
ncbi:hypothetical protein [Hirschia maritima]|uniref:hypothetical protein n=1 Tax=Hirschia maritima TaxID=1121961 RepID=UPI0003AAC1E0|nr:hypothetical protein [Hirschia maritima]